MGDCVRESWVEVGGRESCVLTVGRGVSRGQDSLNNRRVVVIIPGNPGHAAFYQEFMETLHTCLGDSHLTLLAFSHLGHETQSPSLLPLDPTYTLEEQVHHKLQLLDLLLPTSARITLIGHSIGCRIIIDILSRNTSHNFEKIYFLFPTMENMKITKAGTSTWSLCTTWLPLLLLLSTCLHLLLPSFLLRILLRVYLRDSPDFLIESVSKLLNPNHLHNVLMMAKDELETVLDLDQDRRHTLERVAGRLRAYYGTTDRWVPLSYRDRLLERVPSLGETNLEVCNKGIEHAFVMKSGAEMARIVAAWEDN